MNARGATTQPIEGNRRLEGSRGRKVVTQCAHARMRRLAVGDGNQNELDTYAPHVLEQASGSENLVIGMWGHNHKSTRLPLA